MPRLGPAMLSAILPANLALRVVARIGAQNGVGRSGGNSWGRQFWVGNSEKELPTRQFLEDCIMKEHCRGIADPELPTELPTQNG